MFHEEKEKIEKLKNEYNEIPVPEQAKNRMAVGIEKAKKERLRRRRLQVIKGSGMGLAAAMLTVTVMVNTNQSIANAMEQFPVIGAFAKVVTFRTFEENINQLEANIAIPNVEQVSEDAGVQALNKSIEEYADTLIAQYEEEVAANEGEGHYKITSSYEVVTDSSKYLSIRINTTVVMASGAEYVKIFTIDKASGDVISLKKLFADQPDYITTISDYIKKQMEAQMAVDDSKLYFLNTEYPESDFKEIGGEENYYFNSQGELVIVFDEYTVAPGYMGVVEFVIPQDVVEY